MSYFNQFLFVALPYLALIVFIGGSIYRYRAKGFKFSSLSSQFLERNALFWGSVPFHIGLGLLFFGHLIAFLIPEGVIAWNGDPLRLLILEVTAFIFGIGVLWGIIHLIIRRTNHPRLKMVTNRMDLLIELLILLQTVTGLWTAFAFRWGSSWFAAVLTPYLRSIFTFSPDPEAVLAMPLMVQLHIIGAFLIVLLIPFSRLIHFLVAPIHYLWRPYQVVYWNWNRKKRYSTTGPWGPTKPKNT